MKRIALALAVLAAATPSRAQQSEASAAARGRITPLSVQLVQTAASPETRTFTAKASAIIERVLATPAFADPRGFSITRSLKIDSPPPGLPKTHPFVGQVVMIVQNIDLESGARPDASGAYMGRMEGPTFRFQLNDLAALYPDGDWGEDYTHGVSYLPAEPDYVQGFPVVRAGARNVVIIAKPGRNPFVNVTKGEILETRIAEARAVPELGARGQARLEADMAELAQLSPAERAAPACKSSSLRRNFDDCSAPGASFMVRVNQAYFDKGLAKGAVQLVTISTPAEGGHGHKTLEPRVRAAAAALDLQAIQSALD